MDREEDMIVGVCHIAECITFGKQYSETFDVKAERDRILDVFLTLLEFQ